MSKECLNGSEMSKVLKALDIANKRIDELEKYNLDLANESHNKSLAIERANKRVKELESAILDSCSTYHFEPDLSQPASSLNELLIINSKWTLDPEISSDAAKFAIENQVKGAEDLIYAFPLNTSDQMKEWVEKLRKEQDQC